MEANERLNDQAKIIEQGFSTALMTPLEMLRELPLSQGTTVIESIGK